MTKRVLHEKDSTNSNNEARSENNETNNEPVSCVNRISTAFAFFTVEPVLFFYIFSNSILNIAVQTLNLEKACHDLNNTADKCNDWDGNLTADANLMIGHMAKWQEPLESAIPAIVLLFFGAWSDRTGIRKVLILIPLSGRIVSSFGLILSTYFLEWPMFINGIITSFPLALTGGYSMILIGSFSYLSDTTSVKSRTFRLGVAAVFSSLGALPAIYISEKLMNKLGFYGIFGLAMFFYTVGLIYTYFRIRDVKPIKKKYVWYRQLQSLSNPTNAWDTLSIPFNSDPNRTKILLVIAAYIVIIGPVFGEGYLLYDYLSKKFGMNDAAISMYFSYSIQIGICGTTIAMLLLSKYLKLHDAILGIIAITCKTMSCFVCAFAPTKPWFYTGPIFDLFGPSGATIIKSLGTKVVEPDQVAKMGSLIGLVEVITPVLYTSIYNRMYENTKDIQLGAYYLLGVGLTTPAFFIFIILYMKYKKEECDRVVDPESKQLHAHENYITKF